MFGGRLPKVGFQVSEITLFAYPVHGAYVPCEDTPTIHISSNIKSRGLLIATLAHEMVHQHQDKQGLPLTHGSYFKKYASRFAKHGITL